VTGYSVDSRSSVLGGGRDCSFFDRVPPSLISSEYHSPPSSNENKNA
jgi:hypothetical protein